MSKVVNFPGCETPEETESGNGDTIQACLDLAAQRDLAEVFIIGRKNDGDIWFSSNEGDVGNILFLLETAKMIILRESLGG